MPAKRRDEDRYSRSSASQTLPVYGRSSEQTASVFSFGATLVGSTGAYPYDGREAVHSTALTKSASDFNSSRRPSPFLVDDGQTGSYSESDGSLWEVATSLSTCLCSGVLGKVTRQERRPGSFAVSYQCHMSCDEWRQKVNKDRKEKVNLTTPI